MRVAPLRPREIGHEFGLQRRFDLGEHFLLHRIHAQHPLHHIDRDVARQHAQHAGGMVGLQLGKNDRDGLRIFVLQIAREHAFADIGQLVPHRASRRAANILHDLLHPIFGHDPGEQPFGSLQRAVTGFHRSDVAGKLGEQMFDHRCGNPAELRHRARQFLHFLDRKLIPDRRAIFLAQRKHQCGGALA